MQCQPGLALKEMYKMIYAEPTKLMFVAGCSPVTTVVAEAAPVWNLVVVSGMGKEAFVGFVLAGFVQNTNRGPAKCSEFRIQKFTKKKPSPRPTQKAVIVSRPKSSPLVANITLPERE